MEAPLQNPEVRRGLVYVAKIVQNLANNVRFGKEKFMIRFNTFLEQNIERVTQYVKALLVCLLCIHILLMGLIESLQVP